MCTGGCATPATRTASSARRRPTTCSRRSSRWPAGCAPSCRRAWTPSTAASASRTSSTGASRTRCCSSCSPTPASARRSARRFDRPRQQRRARPRARSRGPPHPLRSDDHLIGTYARYPVTFARGEGAKLWDDDGNEYLDFLTGISVSSVGHCHPRVVGAIRAQAAELIHVGNLFYTEPMVRLAQRLAESSLGGKVFFTNSGAEAVEAALKLARRFKQGGDIVVSEGA